MPQLTPGEYDDLPQDVRDQLAGVVRQPARDQKSRKFRRWRGRLMNGDISGSPIVEQQVGYGTGSPFAPGEGDDS